MVFKDIAPLLADHTAFKAVIDELVAGHAPGEVDRVAGIEARGFVLGAPVAYAYGAGFVPVRKAGKLPGRHHVVFLRPRVRLRHRRGPGRRLRAR